MGWGGKQERRTNGEIEKFLRNMGSALENMSIIAGTAAIAVVTNINRMATPTGILTFE